MDEQFLPTSGLQVFGQVQSCPLRRSALATVRPSRSANREPTTGCILFGAGHLTFPVERARVQTAKIFRSDRGQAVRLPAGFRFERDEVYIRRDVTTGQVTLSPRNRKFGD